VGGGGRTKDGNPYNNTIAKYAKDACKRLS